MADKHNPLCTHLFNEHQNMSQWKKDDIIHYEAEKNDFIKDYKDNPDSCTLNTLSEENLSPELLRKLSSGRKMLS